MEFIEKSIRSKCIPATMGEVFRRDKSMISRHIENVFAERIADHFDFRKYFDIIVGSELDGTRIDKAEVIKEALRQAGDPSPERCIMIGDRLHDVVGAKKTGLPCIGVLYGYGSREERLDSTEHGNHKSG